MSTAFMNEPTDEERKAIAVFHCSFCKEKFANVVDLHTHTQSHLRAIVSDPDNPANKGKRGRKSGSSPKKAPGAANKPKPKAPTVSKSTLPKLSAPLDLPTFPLGPPKKRAKPVKPSSLMMKAKPKPNRRKFTKNFATKFSSDESDDSDDSWKGGVGKRKVSKPVKRKRKVSSSSGSQQSVSDDDSGEEVQLVECPHCSQGFRSNAGLSAHVKAKHTVSPPQSEESGGSDSEYEDVQLVECPHCSQGFRSNAGLATHVKAKHGMENGRSSGRKPSRPTKSLAPTRSGKCFTCPICDEDYPSLAKLERHTQTHFKDDDDASPPPTPPSGGRRKQVKKRAIKAPPKKRKFAESDKLLKKAQGRAKKPAVPRPKPRSDSVFGSVFGANDSGEPLLCSFCSQVFHAQSKLWEHTQRHLTQVKQMPEFRRKKPKDSRPKIVDLPSAPPVQIAPGPTLVQQATNVTAQNATVTQPNVNVTAQGQQPAQVQYPLGYGSTTYGGVPISSCIGDPYLPCSFCGQMLQKSKMLEHTQKHLGTVTAQKIQYQQTAFPQTASIGLLAAANESRLPGYSYPSYNQPQQTQQQAHQQPGGQSFAGQHQNNNHNQASSSAVQQLPQQPVVVKNSHPRPDDETLFCSYCSAAFFTQESLWQHTRTHIIQSKKGSSTSRIGSASSSFGFDPSEESNKPKTCSFCGEVFMSQVDLLEHTHQHLMDERQDSAKKGKKRRREEEEVKIVRKTPMNPEFAAKIKSAQQNTQNTGGFGYTPNQANKPSLSYEYTTPGLPIQKKKPPVKQFPCSFCDKVFPSNNELLTHTHQHIRSEKHIQFCCKFCSMKFKEARDLAEHTSAQHSMHLMKDWGTAGRSY